MVRTYDTYNQAPHGTTTEQLSQRRDHPKKAAAWMGCVFGQGCYLFARTFCYTKPAPKPFTNSSILLVDGIEL